MSQQKTKQDRRAEKRAAALRDNLRKRKTAAQPRGEAALSTAPTQQHSEDEGKNKDERTTNS